MRGMQLKRRPPLQEAWKINLCGKVMDLIKKPTVHLGADYQNEAKILSKTKSCLFPLIRAFTISTQSLQGEVH